MLCKFVSAALCVTVGSSTIQRDKYDVNEDAGDIDGIGRMCWNCFSPLRCGAPTEATPQQRRRQKRCGEQRHSNGNGKGILATTAWYSSIAASVAFFLLHSYILLDSGKKRYSLRLPLAILSPINDQIISLFLSLSFSVLVKTLKRNRWSGNLQQIMSPEP